MNSKKSIAFQRALSVWFRQHQRDLPWRRTRNPYEILVSETMLQQTRAAAVTPYYNRWLRRFPSLGTLAVASESDVLHAWQGLGYYTRARNLHRCAQAIAEKFGGRFPNNPDVLKSLPGIGRYTANAIGVFAFNQSLPVVEANTCRVLARLFNLRAPINSTAGRRKLWDAATKLVPGENACDFQNAMMDLGAVVCTARRPRCHVCPVKMFCQAGDPASLPQKRTRPATVRLIELHRLCTRGDAVLLEQCGKRWRGMWILPPLKDDCVKQSSSRDCPIHVSVFPFTHHRVTLQVYRQRSQMIDHRVQRWFCKNELGTIPIPSPHRRAINALLG